MNFVLKDGTIYYDNTKDYKKYVNEDQHLNYDILS